MVVNGLIRSLRKRSSRLSQKDTGNPKFGGSAEFVDLALQTRIGKTQPFYQSKTIARYDRFLKAHQDRLAKKIALGSQKHIELTRTALAVSGNPFLSRSLSLRFSALDQQFLNHVQDGDKSRDRGEWGNSEYHYWSAIKLYPKHAGFIVQYAHSLKEQHKWSDATCYYLQAVCLGEKSSDVIEHLTFTSLRSGLRLNRANLIAIDEFWRANTAKNFSAPLTFQTVSLVFELFLDRHPHSFHEAAECMNSASCLKDFLIGLLERPEFIMYHHQLLRLMLDKHGVKK